MPTAEATSPKVSKRALQALIDLLDAAPRKVFGHREFASFVRGAADEGKVPQSTRVSNAIAALEPRGLSKVTLRPPEGVGSGSALTRYVWGPVSVYSVGLSMRPSAYLSHASAVFLHGLSNQIPKTVYVNKEQTAKPPPSQGLTQPGIDRAFANSQRSSTYIFTHDGYRFVLLSGKSTNRLEVSELKGPQGELVDTTKLERTLIDIAVRPAYAGGVFEVVKAYRAAKDRVSVNTLVATLKQLGYVYPYHQAVGFYLQRAGFEAVKLEKLKQLGLNFDFYLSHKMGPTAFSSEWRIHHPEGL
jgi:hypothetical protein